MGQARAQHRIPMPPPAPHWLVINLDRSVDRLAAVTGDLDGLGIPFTRVPAVDGRELVLPLPGVDAALYRRTHARDLRMAEVGCYISHLRALRTFLDGPHAHAMVLEDDALITPAAARVVEALTAAGAPDDWDVVKFEAHHPALGLPIRPVVDGVRLCALATRPTGSAAYLIDRAGAEALLAHLLPMRVPYDHAFDRGWALGLRVRAVQPFPIVPRPTLSTISPRTETVRKLGVWGKRHSLAWRAGTETMRFVSALHAWARPRHASPPPGPGRAALFDAFERAVAARGSSREDGA